MFENFKPKNPSRDKITESELATLHNERESMHGELGMVMEFFRNNQGNSIELSRDGEKLRIMMNGAFVQTGVVSENGETEAIDKPLSSLSSIEVSTINGAGLSAYEGTAGQKYEGAKNNILKYITETFSKSGFILSV
jgi:hypothetical protein